MNRRKFVRTFGTSTLFSALAFKDRGAFAALNAAGMPLPSGQNSDAPSAGGPGANPVWPRPVIVPIPTETAGVSPHITDLAGDWKFSLLPPPEFWSNRVDPAGWTDVTVPGELTAQGHPIARDSEYPYKRSIHIPAGAKGKKVFLRFDGVYSYARVWVNGKFVREHHGGFTSWDCDITEFVTPGQTAWLTVGVTDRADEISYASNYAKHYIGGILRGVKLLVLPADYVTRFHIETDLDSAYKDATLRVTAAVAFHEAPSARLHLQLRDPQGKSVAIEPSSITLSSEKPEGGVAIPVAAPGKWDSEHPNLYTLDATVVIAGHETQKLAKRIGFRKVERRQNRLYVNGDEVKLRGVCRHDTHPLRGRSVTPDIDEKDALLLRDANVNFVRTSHYPPTESFLEACDRIGIYVEEESAVCFVNQAWSIAALTQSNPDFTSRFLNQFAEMIERDRSHPSVIIWSLGNESHWGTNFAKEREYVKAEDASRPAIFSYPDTVTAGADGYDIYSKHYPKFDGDLTSKDFPKLNDECIHLACYNADTLKRDPGVRDYWGHFIKRFWENSYTSEGCLGGAIWGGFEEVFLLPDAPVGYGQWGIVDEWRRPKPEFWLTKKAYSPVRVVESELPNPGPGQPLLIPVKNWFNHTNLSELKVLCRVGKEALSPPAINAAPGAEGTIRVPARDWRDGEVLELQFYGAGKILIDEFHLRIGKRVVTFPGPQGPAPKVTENNQSLTVQGADFHIVFSKGTGLISEGVFRGKKIIEGGPFLNLGSTALPPWWLINMRYSTTTDEVVINLVGAHVARRGSGPGMSTEFEIRIDGQGLITTKYTLHDPVKAANEVGISYVLSSSIDQLWWDRKALWSAYPNDHIGRPKGGARRQSSYVAQTYRHSPAGPWSEDTKDFFLFGPDDPGGRGTNDFRSLKEDIWYASCGWANAPGQVRAESDGTAAARVEVRPDGKIQFNIDNLWSYTDLGYGVSMSSTTLERGYSNVVRLRLMDS
ncbi:MAG: glycoside hydrolase family 2 TIM barrel-domain containing protein [Terriglobia bacterium]